LRKFARFRSGAAVLIFASVFATTFAIVFATPAQAQQFDVAGGAGLLFSEKNPTASEAYPPPAEKGGIYPSVSILRTFKNRYGYSAEFSTAYKQQMYNGFQPYRPFFYDVNAVFAPHMAKRTDADFMAGFGGQTVLFYTQYGACGFATGCVPRFNSNHFLFHVSASVSYTVWRRFFVRPEAHYYRILNNGDFYSGNVFRLGASIGYSFHPV